MTDFPACHQWPVDWPALRRAVWSDPPAWIENVPDKLLALWHAGRCAICGCMPVEPDKLISDHDHRTGMVRGRLCVSCNVIEGSSQLSEFRLYRVRPPTLILGLEIEYVHPLGFDPAPRSHELAPGYEQERKARLREITSDLGRVMRRLPKHLGGEGLTAEEFAREYPE